MEVIEHRLPDAEQSCPACDANLHVMGKQVVRRELKVDLLGTISGVTQSTLNNIVSGVSKNPTISTIKKVCDGFEISIIDFFNTDTFRNLEQEIK